MACETFLFRNTADNRHDTFGSMFVMAEGELAWVIRRCFGDDKRHLY